jgi:hypothetical protein
LNHQSWHGIGEHQLKPKELEIRSKYTTQKLTALGLKKTQNLETTINALVRSGTKIFASA